MRAILTCLQHPTRSKGKEKPTKQSPRRGRGPSPASQEQQQSKQPVKKRQYPSGWTYFWSIGSPWKRVLIEAQLATKIFILIIKDSVDDSTPSKHLAFLSFRRSQMIDGDDSFHVSLPRGERRGEIQACQSSKMDPRKTQLGIGRRLNQVFGVVMIGPWAESRAGYV